MYFRYLINTPDLLDELVWCLKQTDTFVYDTETNGVLNRFGVQMVGMSICCSDLFACYLPFNHWWEDAEQLYIREALDTLKPFFLSKDYHKICHNTKFDEMVLSRYDIDVDGPGHDTYVQAWMLERDNHPAIKKGLKPLVYDRYGYRMVTYEEVVEQKNRKKKDRDYNFAPVSPQEALNYGTDDAYWAYRLFQDQKRELEKFKLWPAYENVERPFTRVIRKVEAAGVGVDKDYIEHADEELPKIQDRVEGSIYRQAGEVFNIGSPPQLGNILFEKLCIGPGKEAARNEKSGYYVTDKKTLERYAKKYPIVQDVLKRKKIKKTHSTFVVGIKNAIAEDGRVHASFNGCGTDTGRLSSSNPNLQQIEGGEVEGIKIRNFFAPAEGKIFVVADYSQIELRIMAHFSKDNKMLEAFLSGRDFHEETARKMLKIPKDKEVDRKSRVIAKTLNFGIGYGRGSVSVAEQLGVSIPTASSYIGDYFNTFARLASYKDYVVTKARKDGYTSTITGRKRNLLPYIRSNNFKIRSHAERQAFNTRIQGSAADIIKIAMIALQPRLRKFDAEICIQIHDELLIEAPLNYANNVATIMKDTMEKPLKDKNPLRVPLVVEPVIVDRWGKAK